MSADMAARIKEVGLRLYQGTIPEDILIGAWWDRLLTSHELEKLVSSNAHAPSNFMHLFKTPNVMFYTVDKEDRMETVSWVEPVNTSPDACYFSSWNAPEIRGTRRQILIMDTIYLSLFAFGKKTIIGITKQPGLLKLHKKLGYVILEPIPNLFDHSPAWVMYLTQENYEKSRIHAAAVRISGKEMN